MLRTTRMSLIFCDGSCSPNPGCGGWAVIQVKDDDICYENGGREIQTTNNRMELTAFIHALKLASSSDDIIYTDSRLSQQICVSWLEGWKRKGWKKANGSPPENLDLVKELDVHRRDYHTIEWIKAHISNGSKNQEWNNRVDELANAYRKGEK